MRTQELCHRFLTNTNFHKKRIQVISEVVETILQSKELSVSSIGRKMKNNCQTRSNIRKVDRLYSNRYVAQNHKKINQAVAQWLIKTTQPFIVVDGSKLPNSCWYILRASIIAKGRGMTLFECICQRAEQGSLMLYRRFLNGLK
jgi:hypothetical protein